MSKSGKQATRQNVRVICRIRPTNAREIREGGVTCVKFTEDMIEVNNEGAQNKFNFDRVFGGESTQVDVFNETARPLIEDVLNGYNATIFAYGQTGTGKTHTMEGDIHSDELKGIIPRAVEALFDGVSQADENMEFTFLVSYVEIYLEKIRDLLDESRTKTNLTVREDKLKGIYIAGVTEEYVTSVDELLQVMHVGAHNRAVAATGMNEGSSRSHSVFTITVTQKDVRTNALKSGKLQLVDLAGSEMVRKTGASGQQLEEAKMINKSLSALGQVINALTDEKASHVPYRDSKLTRVLQDSLGGNSKTVLIVAVSPSSFNASETVSTLRFGMRAKSIENKVKVNATRSVEELEALLVRAENAIDAQSTFILSLTARIEALQSQLQAQQGQGGLASSSADGDSDRPAPGVSVEPAAPPPPGQSTVVLEEGKVIVDVSRLETEAALIEKLQAEVLRLTQELEDERSDSQRKEGEITQLHRLLKEKDKYVQEATAAVTELQRTNDGLNQRVETLLAEKISVVGELESVKATLADSSSRVHFEMQDLEVSLQTLQAENAALRREIAELSGDSTEKTSSSQGKNLINSDGVDSHPTSTKERPAPNNRRISAEASEELQLIPQGKVHADRRQLLELLSDQFATLCLENKVDDNVSTQLFAILDTYAVEADRSFALTEEKLLTTEKAQTKRIKDLEEQRGRLEKDLQSRIESLVQLQMRFDAFGRGDSRAQDAMAAERDKQRQRSLQQRLEQLVAVHRQLLRKFASLELENAEWKKKTQLREERIKQLEDNSRSLVQNVRVQAEKHLAEVATFKEQIQIMKSEFEKQFEAARQQMEAQDLPNRSPGLNRAPRTMQPKSIRGGGVAGRSFYMPSSTAGGDDGEPTASAAPTTFSSPMSAGLLHRYQSFAGTPSSPLQPPMSQSHTPQTPQTPQQGVAVEEPKRGLAARFLGMK